jgi:Domain of unknown function (DUF4276)
VSAKICIEGGGNDAYTLRTCKSAFVRYCEKVVAPMRMPRIVACGSRDETYSDFKASLSNGDYDLVALLVDSEDPVQTAQAIDHLRNRDHWKIPQTSAKQMFLMAQCMESWFLADKDTLENYYGQGFLRSSLPPSPNVEAIPKATVMTSLEHASAPCQKKSYHKTNHGFAILALINPILVEAASQHAKLFNDFLRSL